MCGLYLENGATFASHLLMYFSNAFIIFTSMSYVVMSVAFVVYADKVTQIEEIMYAILQCANGAAVIGVYFSLLPRKREASDLTCAIQKLVNERG